MTRKSRFRENVKICRSNKSTNNDDGDAENRCPWWVNSSKDDNCLWIYIKNHSAIDGSMSELTQNQIAHLLGWSNTKTHFMIKESVKELIYVLRRSEFKHLVSGDPDHLKDFTTFDIDIPDPIGDE